MFKKLREPVSGLTHLGAAIMSVVGTVFLIVYAMRLKTPKYAIGLSVFGVSLILLYTASSLYHLLPVKPEVIRILRKIDHIMIYVLIAGTYTPICLYILKGLLGIGFLITIWTLAAVGIVLKIVWFGAPRWLYTVFYLVMGWMAVVIICPLGRLIPLRGLNLLISGGLSYTIGAIIYATKWPLKKSKIFGFHEIFHIFIMIGSIFHYFFILKYAF